MGQLLGRSKTRYCDSTCQHDHWRRGHKQICKRIHRGGNAEQYHADKKYKEAVAVAVEACADDTKGQKCYICTQALHWKTKEGLVRGCSCRGTAGFAHVSCLAEQAKILVAEAEENNLVEKAMTVFRRWDGCSLCEQDYHGVVACALGWACWKTYLGRPETDWTKQVAINQLGNGLSVAGHEDALSVQEAELSMQRRIGSSEESILITQGNIAMTYHALGRLEEALLLRQEVYSGRLKLNGEEDYDTIREAFNYTTSLVSLKRYTEAKSLLRRTLPVAERVVPVQRRILGNGHDLMLRMRANYATTLCNADGATVGDLREAVTLLEDTERTARRVLGGAHPLTMQIEKSLRCTRTVLARFNMPPPEPATA